MLQSIQAVLFVYTVEAVIHISVLKYCVTKYTSCDICLHCVSCYPYFCTEILNYKVYKLWYLFTLWKLLSIFLYWNTKLQSIQAVIFVYTVEAVIHISVLKCWVTKYASCDICLHYGSCYPYFCSEILSYKVYKLWYLISEPILLNKTRFKNL